MEKSIKLVSLYSQVCEIYNQQLAPFVQRFSNNANQGKITDQELITIYLFCIIEEQKVHQRKMYEYIKSYWFSWFPALPSYQAFNERLNRLIDVFPILINYMIENNHFDSDLLPILVGDSCPIKTCSAKRHAKVGLNIVDKSYCASKEMWYYGVKLHILSQKIPHKLPFPQYVGMSAASCPDLLIMKSFLEDVSNVIIVLDKAYCDTHLDKQMSQNRSILMTPSKEKKGESLAEKQRNKAYQSAVGSAVAQVRQPIESFFNWLQEKTAIQYASKIRSEAGLKLHVFGKLAAAIMILTNF